MHMYNLWWKKASGTWFHVEALAFLLKLAPLYLVTGTVHLYIFAFAASKSQLHCDLLTFEGLLSFDCLPKS